MVKLQVVGKGRGGLVGLLFDDWVQLGEATLDLAAFANRCEVVGLGTELVADGRHHIRWRSLDASAQGFGLKVCAVTAPPGGRRGGGV
jgi:hypothetical protein